MMARLNFTLSDLKELNKEFLQEEDVFEDLYNNYYMTAFLVTLYFLGFFSCLGLILISWFEKSGQAGPFRSLVNQLITLRLDQMVLLYIIGCGINISRRILGPFPGWICKTASFIQFFTVINICHLTILISATRFAFVFYFKSIPTMNDKLISTFFMMITNLWSFLAVLSKMYVEEKTLFLEVNSVWKPSRL